MIRGQALRYAGWYFVDRPGPRLLAALFIFAGVTALLHAGLSSQSTPPADASIAPVLGQLFQQMGFVVVIILMHGIVAADRTGGFFRFYLAKPISPVWFYGQSLMLTFAAWLIATAGFVAFASWFIRPLWPWHLFGNALGLFALVGMLIFVFSTVTRFDWLGAIGVLMVCSLLRARFPADKSALGKVVNAVLLPNHLIGWQQANDAAHWAWITGWALGLFACGLLVLRLRPIGED